MELPETGIYCVAKASSTHQIESTALLPYPIDLSRQRAELGIKYIAVTPNWKYARDLFVILTDNPARETKEDEKDPPLEPEPKEDEKDPPIEPEPKEDEKDPPRETETKKAEKDPSPETEEPARSKRTRRSKTKKAEAEEVETIIFDDIINESADETVSNLRKQLEAHNGKTKNPLLKIVKNSSRTTSVFRVRENAIVLFSHGMAQVFGVKPNHPYDSKPDKGLDIPITVREDDLTSSTDIYYLKSDQIQSNYLLDNKQDKIIEVLHIPGIETRDFHPTMTYVETDTNLLERLKFTLYNESNQIVASESCDMYIICHIRPLKRFFPTFSI